MQQPAVYTTVKNVSTVQIALIVWNALIVTTVITVKSAVIVLIVQIVNFAQNVKTVKVAHPVITAITVFQVRGTIIVQNVRIVTKYTIVLIVKNV